MRRRKPTHFYYPRPKLICSIFLSWETAFPRPFAFRSEKLTFLIAISHACLLVSRTRTRRRNARARARSTQVPRA